MPPERSTKCALTQSVVLLATVTSTVHVASTVGPRLSGVHSCFSGLHAPAMGVHPSGHGREKSGALESGESIDSTSAPEEASGRWRVR